MKQIVAALSLSILICLQATLAEAKPFNVKAIKSYYSKLPDIELESDLSDRSEEVPRAVRAQMENRGTGFTVNLLIDSKKNLRFYRVNRLLRGEYVAYYFDPSGMLLAQDEDKF